MEKTNDFEKDTHNGYYEHVMRSRWNKETKRYNNPDGLPDTWSEDFNAFLLSAGVPKQYVNKVSQVSWDRGHSAGYSEVLNFSYDLIYIFETTR